MHEKHHFLFKVRACSDAVLELSSNMTSETGFEYALMLGLTDSSDGLSITNVRSGRAHTSHYAGVVSCSAFRYFWLNWTDTTLRVGQGHIVGEKQLIEFSEDKGALLAAFRYMALRGGQGYDVEWEFSRTSGT